MPRTGVGIHVWSNLAHKHRLYPLYQARFSDYNQRMRSHCLSKSGGFHGDTTG
jgi:hypothetical protein